MLLEAKFEPVDLTTAVFRLTGRMTLGLRLSEIESQISETAGHGIHKLILDLAAVDFLDSAGLGLLMMLYGNMKLHGGQLRLVAPGARVREVLRMTRADAILPIDSDLAAAIAA